MVRVPRFAALAAALLPLAVAAPCRDDASCQVHVDGLVERLAELKGEMRSKQSTLAVLEDVRLAALTGRRVELPSAQRRHLERGSAPISEVTFDARHRPISTNASRHFKPLITVAEQLQVQHHGFLTLRKSASSKAGGTSALLVVVDELSTLSVYDFDGEALLRSAPLGHGEGRQIVHLALSPGSDSHFVMTADDAGVIRVHDIKIVAQKTSRKEEQAEGGAADGHNKEATKRIMQVSTNFSCSFTLPEGERGEARRLTALQPVERGSTPWLVTGDSAGGISVFHRNGTVKSRVKVTEDPGGIRGFLKGGGQMVVYWSSHSFGYFSSSQIDVQYPPCTGWNAPVVDMITDPANIGSRVILALADGDVVVYTTTSGKAKTCDLTLKFPHVSSAPFKLQSFRGHVMAMPVLSPEAIKAGRMSEIFVFNVAAMDAGYGATASKTLVLQASFRPKSPLSMDLIVGTDRSKGSVAITYEGIKGVELFEVNLKQPTVPKGEGGAEGGGDSWASYLEWFPKAGVFGIALVGVVFWNIRKITNNQQVSRGAGGGGGALDGFDEDSFKEALRERRMMKEMAGGTAGGLGGGAGGLGASLGLGSEGRGMGSREPQVHEVDGGDD